MCGSGGLQRGPIISETRFVIVVVVVFGYLICSLSFFCLIWKVSESYLIFLTSSPPGHSLLECCFFGIYFLSLLLVH